ncbi:MAG: CvpA family protein [Peptococcaceae bacterium]|nr:CvpA family protein [Peptococcaceae bacterium]
MQLRYAIDAVFVLIIILIGIHGFRRGFLGSTISMGGKIGAVLVAVCFRVPFSQLLDSLFHLRQKITPVVFASVNTLVTDGLEQKTAAFPLPPSPAASSYGSYVATLQDTFVNHFSDTCVSYLLEIIAVFILLFMVYFFVSLLIKIFIRPSPKKIFDKHSGSPWNKGAALSKGTSLLLSCVCMILFISLFCGVIHPLLQVAPQLESELNHSFFYPLLTKTSQPYIEAIISNPSNHMTNFFPPDLLPVDLLPPELTPTFKSLKI